MNQTKYYTSNAGYTRSKKTDQDKNTSPTTQTTPQQLHHHNNSNTTTTTSSTTEPLPPNPQHDEPTIHIVSSSVLVRISVALGSIVLFCCFCMCVL
ncbi:hypothetical protein PGABG02_0005800 [Plasmodium sp. DRC-Itaito]|nr:hypothetical protein PGABG02_0005800 [Plasmodium sp. DRC-Itaito]